MAVLKELILTVSTFGKGVAVLKELTLTVSTLVRFGGLDRTDFNSILPSGRCGGFERTWI